MRFSRTIPRITVQRRMNLDPVVQAIEALRNDLVEARRLNDLLYPLHYAMFEDASPAPVKYALSRVHDWILPGVRLPLVECSDHAKAAVDQALEHAGLV